MGGNLADIAGLAGPPRYSRLPQNVMNRVASSPVVAEVEAQLTTAIEELAGRLDVLTGGDKPGEGRFSDIDYAKQGSLAFASYLLLRARLARRDTTAVFGR